MSETLLETDIYGRRFSQADLAAQRRLWKPICRYIQRFVPRGGATLDLGAGYCHFINNIESGRKLALDLNPEGLRRYADNDVECLTAHGASLDGVASASLDAVFASNVYEHFDTRENVAASFREVRRALKPAGRFIILQPNFAYCWRRYFDFFDHRLAFTHLGMIEGLEMSGFEIEKAVPRFLPYTTKSRLPQSPWLVAAYLRFPPAWRLLGSQMFLVARKP